MNDKTKRPIKTAGYSHAKADARKSKRRIEAEKRQAKYDEQRLLRKIESEAAQ